MAGGDSLDPIFSAAIQYQPFKVTQISLIASRTESSSDYYLAAQESAVTTVGINLDQRLLQKFHLGLGIDYSTTDYSTPTSVTTAGAANRSDHEVSFNARLSHPFLKRGTWSVFYQYSDNDSSQAGYTFQSNQTGIEFNYSY